MDLKGTTIVITGAAQSLGEKIAETVATRDATVALVKVDHLKMKMKDTGASVFEGRQQRQGLRGRRDG